MLSIENLPNVILGGAPFAKERPDVDKVIKKAFDDGINAIDTSPYYGDSEINIGNALRQIKYPREKYFLITKVGRIGLNEFDYSPEWVVKSVKRSLERLDTDYFDLVYLHDVEFNKESDILAALRQLRKLKDQGIIRNFGISGYPMEVLYDIGCKVIDIPEIGQLDAMLSYCHLNIQNTLLDDWHDKLKKDCKLKQLGNASILSMSLLTNGPTGPEHPCSQNLKDTVAKAADVLLKEYGVYLAELATRFSFRKWKGKGFTVLGVGTLDELAAAEKSYSSFEALSDSDDVLVQKFWKLIGNCFNERWDSGLWKANA